MTEQQIQEDRDALFTIHSDYAESVTLMRKLKACAKDEMACPCVECIILRRFMKFRDRAWHAYMAISAEAGQSASQEAIEAAAQPERQKAEAA